MSDRETWLSSFGGDVDCVACGEEVPRSNAREYDKEGDRWDRTDKDLEYLCKSCYWEYCHQPRDRLEATLVEAGAGTTDDETFLEQYYDIVSRDTPPGHDLER